VGQIHNDPTQPGPSWVDGKLLRAIDQDFVTALLSSAAAGPQSPFVGVELRQLGAATEVDVEGGSAASGRGAAFTFAVIAVDPATFATAAPDAAREVTRAVQGWVSSEKNINFSGDPRALASTAWSPDVMARLADVRRRYDPDGLFAP